MAIKKMSLSVDEKIWILNHWKGNPHILQNKIALNFSAKLKKQLTEHVPPKSFKKTINFKPFWKQITSLKEKEPQDLILVGDNDEEKMVILCLFPKLRSKIAQKASNSILYSKFFQNNKKLFARRLKKIKLLILLISFA